ncbi:MAG: hypothetical protein GKR88_13945 [Flavobacteriaceae bacterium]|nr:MAG: hypothetical protein GKR88_13945 [Flavobacteriaceae bacterium]
MTRLLLISLLLASFPGNASVTDRSKNNPLQIQKTVVSDTLLVNIQSKITDAFVLGIRTKKNAELLVLRGKLEDLYRKKEQNLILYWQSYLQYYLSLFYTIEQDKKLAEKEIDKGVEILKGIENKNSEDYALLATSQNFSIQFKGMKVIFISNSVKKNGKKAIALDPDNLRAYYALGSNDFFTPKMYGGGKKAEGYFKKAISLPNQKIKNPYLPSWGKDDAYEYLIRFYIREERWKEAVQYFQEGIKLYPNSYNIKALANRLKGK